MPDHAAACFGAGCVDVVLNRMGGNVNVIQG